MYGLCSKIQLLKLTTIACTMVSHFFKAIDSAVFQILHCHACDFLCMYPPMQFRFWLVNSWSLFSVETKLVFTYRIQAATRSYWSIAVGNVSQWCLLCYYFIVVQCFIVASWLFELWSLPYQRLLCVQCFHIPFIDCLSKNISGFMCGLFGTCQVWTGHTCMESRLSD